MAGHYTILQSAKAFERIESVGDLCDFLHTSAMVLTLNSIHPAYHVFPIKKKNGKFRLIEDPSKPLKQILKKLNKSLQAVYYKMRPEPVYGFCMNNNKEEERNIVNNARKHVGQQWLLNLDFSDFFHSVTSQKVQEIFTRHFRKMDEELISLLTGLVCYHHRLPMGSPTSPVLSNFAALNLDAELLQICKCADIIYTRFADDCTFSSQTPIDHTDIKLIKEAIEANHFRINEEKTKLYGPDDDKIVTGIVVGDDDVALPDTYINKLKIEIERLKQVMLTEQRYMTGMSYKKIRLFQQELMGKINFVEMVSGQSEENNLLHNMLQEALHPAEDFESNNWLELPYFF